MVVRDGGQEVRGRTRRTPHPANTVQVVAIGASAGGLEPIGHLLNAIPSHSGLAFVVIQHLDPVVPTLLPELLTKHTTMTVRTIEDGIAARANEVYVVPPGAYLSITSGVLHLSVAPPGVGVRMPIDRFLGSLAHDRGKCGIGIILSGTGADGGNGLKALKHAGGLTLVQDPEEAQFDGMPRNAIATAAPDLVLTVKEMPAAILRYVRHHYVSDGHRAGGPEPEAQIERQLAAVVDTLRAVTGHHFEFYKTGTLRRRTERRMALNAIESWTEYLAFLREMPGEAVALAKDMLIHVTEFFRDSEAFARLGEWPLSRLLARHSSDRPLRVWVAGCSTGEEAYSVGMMLTEQIAAAGRKLKLQIFATDVDEGALQVARAAIYPETILSNVSTERLARFFVRQDRQFRVGDELRSSIVFSRHDLLTDPPFSRLDLISCRNLFIYLNPDAQRQVLARFHFALRNGGLLFLGSCESADVPADLFEAIDAKHRIYERVTTKRSTGAALPAIARAASRGGPANSNLTAAPRLPSLSELVERRILESYAPAAVVVNQQFGPLYYFGPIDRYLQISPGEAHQDLLSIARDGLRPNLRETVGRAFRGKRRFAARGVRFRHGGRLVSVTIEAQRIGDVHDDLVLVSFIDEPSHSGRAAPPGAADATVVAQLKRELTDTRRELNRTIRDLHHSIEDRNATREEARSRDEEFLSTNEELETSKEELQSLNEELTTVNMQLRQSLEQYRQTATDLSNLMNSTEGATIFLDNELRIKIFNIQMKALFAVIESDIGRPLTDLLPKFSDPQLLRDATEVCVSGTPKGREVHAASGAWYLRTVLPYRTETGAINGVVVTFVDISRLKQAELEAAAARAYTETVVDTVREPLVVLDQDLKIVSYNAAFQASFNVEADGRIAQSLRELDHPIFANAELIELLSCIPDQQVAKRPELSVENAGGGYRAWRASVRRFHVLPSEKSMMLLALEDITDQRRVIRGQLQLTIDALPNATIAIDSEGRMRFVNKPVGMLFGYDTTELLGQKIDLLVPAALRADHVRLYTDFLKQPMMRPMGTGLNIKGVTKRGQEIPLDIGLGQMTTADGPLTLASIRDLRAERRGEAQSREAKAEADRANRAKSQFLAAASHDLRQPVQTFGLLLGVLERRAVDAEARAILGKLDATVAGMTELLDTLSDVNQIDSGGITLEISEFAIASLLARARDEFESHAIAKGLRFRTVPCSATIRSDRRILTRMISNLLSNAVKYTDHGDVLLGCRRRGDTLRIEVWDSGIGIAAENLNIVFDEFQRLDRNDSSKFGLGLGLYIVQRFAALLGHKVEVRSRPGKGTMFALIVPLIDPLPFAGRDEKKGAAPLQPTILLIEDDPAQLDTLRILLELEGYHVVPVRTGDEALARIRGPAKIRPNILMADYNLPGSMTGLQIIKQVRSRLGAQIPALIVSGDKSAVALQEFDANALTLVTKPVKVDKLLTAVASLVKSVTPAWEPVQKQHPAVLQSPAAATDATVGVIDDEPGVRDAFRLMLEAEGHHVATYASSEAFLSDPNRSRLRCLVVDLGLPGLDGLALQAQLRSEQVRPAIIFVTGTGDLPIAVKAMRDGAADFLLKPVQTEELRTSVARVLKGGEQSANVLVEEGNVDALLATLTERERQIMDRMLLGQATKVIAADLNISQRTAEHHRHNLMRKMGAKSLAMLVRMVGMRAGGGSVGA